MSEKGRDQVVQRRLDAWGEWLHAPGRTGAAHPLARLMDGVAPGDDDCRPAPSARIPINEIECGLTDRAVRALPTELKAAVTVWHAGTARTMEHAARELGVVKTTLWRRLAQADLRIAEWLREYRARNTPL
ncbi:Uncharacterised protein [Bordetella ansorpii]|uniref:Uncharacterized protein n=1 Tax=Bordetella ansorpii TaxID=288768 RepID=A0A157RM74_9BORD|nr:hypothetical protein [Bordetella ansorpii]SAI58966.1 Uncharacterised protein [Bordetella ansorpii]